MAQFKQGAQGSNTSSVEVSPARRKRRTKQLRAQEKRWAAKAGPVTTRKIEDEPDGPGR